MQVLVISCSLNPGSKSAMLAAAAVERLRCAEVAVTLLDMREHRLPLCDGRGAYGHDLVPEFERRIAEADAAILAVPVYNYYANAAAKNLIELTGGVWQDKVIGFMAAAGGHASYMSLMPLANSMMLDFRCLVIPRFVYAIDADFDEAGAVGDAMYERIDQLCREVARVSTALGSPVASTPVTADTSE